MTEEEAKTKWCCQSQATENPFKCDGSLCMAWRWHGVLSDGKRHTSDEAYYAAQNPNLPPNSGGMNAGDERLGHCGLAGKP